VCWDVLLQDADLVLVHEQERLVQDKGGWHTAYCMPHHSDAGVLAMRCALAFNLSLGHWHCLEQFAAAEQEWLFSSVHQHGPDVLNVLLLRQHGATCGSPPAAGFA
jgi:hypothetical protein